MVVWWRLHKFIDSSTTGTADREEAEGSGSTINTQVSAERTALQAQAQGAGEDCGQRQEAGRCEGCQGEEGLLNTKPFH